jgi:hypothetical protein
VTEEGPIPWLLDPENPSARYLALTSLLDRPAGDPKVERARAEITGWGPARAILDAQWPDGYWMQPGRGYGPKHKATVWQIVFLAALGAPRSGPIDRACSYVLDHSRLPDGRFSAYKTARGAVACLNGNLLRAFYQLGYRDPRLGESVQALAEMVLHDRFCCRYAAGPASSRRVDWQPCVSGAVKALSALATIPQARRSAEVQSAIEAGVNFLFDAGLQGAADSGGGTVRRAWQEFGFPPGNDSDLLEALDVLGQLGAPKGPGIDAALEAVQQKQQESGRWLLGRTPQNTWTSFGQIGKPNKWVTLQALRALKGWKPHENRDSVRHSR